MSRRSTSRDDWEKISGVTDSNQFSHQIDREHQGTRKLREEDEWCRSDIEVQKLIACRFPTRDFGDQRIKAELWATVIYRFLRNGHSARQIVSTLTREEVSGETETFGPMRVGVKLGVKQRRNGRLITVSYIYRLVQEIRYFAAGLTSVGKPYKRSRQAK